MESERVLLLDDAQVVKALNITPEDLDWLVATEQLLPITLCGKRRFVAAAVEQLIRVYQATQRWRMN